MMGLVQVLELAQKLGFVRMLGLRGIIALRSCTKNTHYVIKIDIFNTFLVSFILLALKVNRSVPSCLAKMTSDNIRRVLVTIQLPS
jgi:hypothetical protein